MNDPAMGEPKKRITRFRYDMGPMGYLSDQIMKEMQRVGYPVREFCIYRSPEDQDDAYERGVTKARAFSSAHQFYGAADIIHEKWAWFADDAAPKTHSDRFWDRLWDCVEVVSEKHKVRFSRRIPWDPAHVELANWRDMREVVAVSRPTTKALEWYFQATLPKVWAAHQAAQNAKR